MQAYYFTKHILEHPSIDSQRHTINLALVEITIPTLAYSWTLPGVILLFLAKLQKRLNMVMP